MPPYQTADLAGRCVGNSYILVCPVGQGTTGTVWRGIERTTGEQVAVKLLHEGLLRQPKLVTRFVQERSIMMLVRHEHIVGVRELFSAGESLGLVMDYVTGGSLRDRLHAEGTLAPAEAARLLAQAATALAEAHALGVVHRDVKPDNILLQATAAGPADVRLTDFGIARLINAAGLTNPHSIIGTPYYMPPEVITGAEAGPAADVYALGIMLYELVAGRTPYAGESLAVLHHHLENEPVRPAGLPDAVWTVIAACLQKDPNRRPATADLAAELREVARSVGGAPALPVSAPLADPASVPARSHAAGPAAGGVHSTSWAAAGPRAGRRAARSAPGRSEVAVRSAGPSRRAGSGPHRPRGWPRSRSAMIVTLVVAALIVSGAGGLSAWKWLDTNAEHAAAGGPAPVQGFGSGPALPSAHPPADGLPEGARPPRSPGAPQASITGRMRPPPGAAHPGASAGPPPDDASAGPRPEPGTIPYGKWQCGDEPSWDLLRPVLAQPCHALGGAIRVIAHLEGTPGIQADVELTVRDAQTDEVAAGPYDCPAMTFTDFAQNQTCGPADLKAPHGHRYVVVASWEYTGPSLLSGGSATGPEFTW